MVVFERAAAAAGVAIFVICAAVASTPACSGVTQNNAAAADSAEIADTTVFDSAAVDTFFPFPDASGADTVVERPDPPDAGPPPTLPCGDSGGDTTLPWDAEEETSVACPLPPSYCLDDRWLVSYVNGTCEDGGCQYWRTYQDCHAIGASRCVIGFCRTVVGK